MEKKVLGFVAAAAAAGLFSTSPVLAGPKIVDGHYCQNNTCKGKSACGGYGNANGCAGQNACKGKGWLEAEDKDSCTEAGGKWTKAPAAKKGKKKRKEG